MPQLRPFLVLVLLALVASVAGCAASGASTGNFDLHPTKIGWHTGEEAHFTLNLSSSLTHSAPSYTIDTTYAVEEIKFTERGMKFGGDFSTKDSTQVALRFAQNGTEGKEFRLDAANSSLDVYVKVPQDLRNSEYALEMKLFNVGWVKSDAFRVDTR